MEREKFVWLILTTALLSTIHAKQNESCMHLVEDISSLVGSTDPGYMQEIGQVYESLKVCLYHCCKETEGQCNAMIYSEMEGSTKPNCIFYRWEPVGCCNFQPQEGQKLYISSTEMKQSEKSPPVLLLNQPNTEVSLTLTTISSVTSDISPTASLVTNALGNQSSVKDIVTQANVSSATPDISTSASLVVSQLLDQSITEDVLTPSSTSSATPDISAPARLITTNDNSSGLITSDNITSSGSTQGSYVVTASKEFTTLENVTLVSSFQPILLTSSETIYVESIDKFMIGNQTFSAAFVTTTDLSVPDSSQWASNEVISQSQVYLNEEDKDIFQTSQTVVIQASVVSIDQSSASVQPDTWTAQISNMNPSSTQDQADQSTVEPFVKLTNHSNQDPSIGFRYNPNKDSKVENDENENSFSNAALISALSMGCLFFVASVAILGKRFYDSWTTRNYSRLERNYLVDDMYN